jgi:hypothetical protein
MAPGAVLEQYAADLSDLPVRARQLLGELQQQPDRLMWLAGEGCAPVSAGNLQLSCTAGCGCDQFLGLSPSGRVCAMWWAAVATRQHVCCACALD